jgi:uncharacterized membrane protein
MLMTGVYPMRTFIKSIKILHIWLHFFLILALSLLPILTNAEIITSFLYVPVGYLVLIIISFNIENKLNKYLDDIAAQEPTIEKARKSKRCLIYRGVCCFHS